MTKSKPSNHNFFIFGLLLRSERIKRSCFSILRFCELWITSHFDSGNVKFGDMYILKDLRGVCNEIINLRLKKKKEEKISEDFADVFFRVQRKPEVEVE